MKNDKQLTLLYSVAQGLYWMSYSVAVSFSAVYLQGVGYSNTELGIIMSAGHLLGFFLSNVLGTFIDKYEKMTVPQTVTFVLIINTAVIFLDTFLEAKCTLLSVMYPIYVALTVCVNGLIIKLWADFDHQGQKINYSFARAIGSALYVLLTTFLGKLVLKTSVALLPKLSILIICLQFLIFFLLSRKLKPNSTVFLEVTADMVPAISSFGDFVKNNLPFFVLLLGLSVIFLSHYITGSFLINVARNIGGDTASVGYLSGFIAALEIPVIMLYPRIKKKFGCRRILKIAIVMFSFKALAFALAPSMPLLFVACLFHIPSYAIYIPTIVDYVKENISYEDSAKGQSLAASVTTLGSVFAGFIGGRLYDQIGAYLTMLVAFGISFIGILFCMLGLRKQNKKQTSL